MRKIFFALAILSFTACQSGSDNDISGEAKDPVGELKSEVMEVHDRVMPEMNPMGNLQRKLKKQAEGRADSARYLEASKRLEKAQEMMMTWMKEFKQPEDQGWSQEKAIEYLNGEKEKMREIEEYTEEAIANAQMVLGKEES